MSADRFEVERGAPLSRLDDTVDWMLAGGSSARALGTAAEEALFADAVVDGDALLGDAVSPGDVVVAHDGVSALVARAARERGALVVWRVRTSEESSHGMRQARDLLRSFTVGVDAYVLRWLERGMRGEVIEAVATAMPRSDIVAVTRTPGFGGGEELRYLAWRIAYAEIVRDDRREHVGGTLRTRPAVAAR